MDNRQTKYCMVCGRRMEWRKKWRRSWDQVKYCSAACRKTGVSATDRQLESAILELLQFRGAGKSICPSEAAVKVSGSNSDTVWKPMMPSARSAARRLFAKGLVDIMQKGQLVDPSTAKGPIRIRLRRGS